MVVSVVTEVGVKCIPAAKHRKPLKKSHTPSKSTTCSYTIASEKVKCGRIEGYIETMKAWRKQGSTQTTFVKLMMNPMMN